MILLWIISTLCTMCTYSSADVRQISDPNCLRLNPRVLDAEFTLYNSYDYEYTVTEEDVAEHTALFATRFNHGHELGELYSDMLKIIVDGVSLYTNSSNTNFKIFLRGTQSFIKGVDLGRMISMYKKDYEVISNINSENQGVVAGLYSPTGDDVYYEIELIAITTVFGTKESATMQSGHSFENCRKAFRNPNAPEYLQRLHFITCRVDPAIKPYPEESADDVIRMCDNLRDNATSLNVTANMSCLVGYPSYGISPKGIPGTVSDFQRFWCRILSEVMKDPSHAQIIMRSAFDNTPMDYKDRSTNVHDSIYHEGWWRRRHVNSYDPNAFLEKVEELEGGRELGNCTAECSHCVFDEDCCHGQFCSNDTSFQPFERNGGVPRVCMAEENMCAPRHVRPTKTKFVPARSTGKFATSLIFTILIPSIVLLIVVGGVGFLIHRRKKDNRVFSAKELRNFFGGSSSSSTRKLLTGQVDTHEVIEKLPYDVTLEISKHDFEIYEDQILGSGEFGVVMKGRLGNEEVAVKTTLPGVEKTYIKALLFELKILSYLGHNENIVNLRGAHTSQLTYGKLFIFMEVCPFGDLLSLLRSHRDTFQGHLEMNAKVIEIEDSYSRLTLKNLIQWSIQIAQAMEHLSRKNVIHADIAARNILVFSWDKVKLADFGLSRRLYEYSYYVENKKGPLPWRHMAIEALSDFKLSIQSDVWSFGVTLWEIFSLGKVPYPGHSLCDDFVDLLQDGLRLECPKHVHPLLYEAMTSCWTKDVQARPPISLVLSKLVAALDEIFTRDLYILINEIK